jgi:hypothetical protein
VVTAWPFYDTVGYHLIKKEKDMLFELLILAGLFCIFVGVTLLGIINWLEAREERKTSERLSKSFRKDNNVN